MPLNDKYNTLYRKQNPFGEKEEEIVRNILKYRSSGTVLDLGAGQGRNALFLANIGFNVTAIDVSKIGIKMVKKQATEKNIKINVVVGDIKNLDKSKIYDVILLIFVLHHLSNLDARRLIAQVRSQTAVSGLNVVATFTKNGDFYRNNPKTDYFYPNERELKDIYFGWEILEWDEKTTRAFQKTSEGKPMFNMTSFLIARKPV